jgi:hypothetical protein
VPLRVRSEIRSPNRYLLRTLLPIIVAVARQRSFRAGARKSRADFSPEESPMMLRIPSP